MKSYEELLAENKALVAQAELMRLEFSDARKTLQFIASCGHDSTDKEVADTVLIESRLWISRYDDSCFRLNPQQCLAEIKAEAGRAGFVAGAEMWSDYGVKSRYKDDYLVDIKADASKYAAKIRNTGTWLKDSNVNGGKRQGGEK